MQRAAAKSKVNHSLRKHSAMAELIGEFLDEKLFFIGKVVLVHKAPVALVKGKNFVRGHRTRWVPVPNERLQLGKLGRNDLLSKVRHHGRFHIRKTRENQMYT